MNLDNALQVLSTGLGPSSSHAVQAVVETWTSRLGPQHCSLRKDTETVSFVSDMSSIRLRGMGFVPVLLLGKDCAALRNAVSVFLLEWLPGNQLPILACLTDSAFDHIRWKAGVRAGNYLVLSRSELRSILVHDNPARLLRHQVLHQIPLRELIPFSPSNPAEGAVFFGRRTELDMLTQQGGVDYAICGHGGMGKTSILRQMQWVLKRSLHHRAQRIVEIDLMACRPDADAAAKEIAQRVSHTSFSHGLTLEELVPFFRRMKGTDPRFRDGPIELVIDEADAVLANDRRMYVGGGDARERYPLLRALRHAENQKLIRVTACGRTEMRGILSDVKNPFHDRMKLIDVGPLDQHCAKELLFTPLEHLGVQIEASEDLLDTLLARCQGNPLRIHRLGLAIADRVAGRTPRRLEAVDCKCLEPKLSC